MELWVAWEVVRWLVECRGLVSGGFHPKEVMPPYHGFLNANTPPDSQNSKSAHKWNAKRNPPSGSIMIGNKPLLTWGCHRRKRNAIRPIIILKNSNMHVSVLDGTLRDMGQVHYGICEIGILPAVMIVQRYFESVKLDFQRMTAKWRTPLCLTAPGRYLNQCWLTINWVLWHSPKTNFTESSQDINC